MDLIANVLDIDPYYNNKYCIYVVVELLQKLFRDELIFLHHPLSTPIKTEFILKNVMSNINKTVLEN